MEWTPDLRIISMLEGALAAARKGRITASAIAASDALDHPPYGYIKAQFATGMGVATASLVGDFMGANSTFSPPDEEYPSRPLSAVKPGPPATTVQELPRQRSSLAIGRGSSRLYRRIGRRRLAWASRAGARRSQLLELGPRRAPPKGLLTPEPSSRPCASLRRCETIDLGPSWSMEALSS